MSSRLSRRPGRARTCLTAGVVAVTALGLVGLSAVPAQVALPTGPTTTGVTGSRPSATYLTFPISDQVQAKVDVATGNLLLTTSGLSLVGVNNTIPIGAAYNSRGWQDSASIGGLGHGWTGNFAGAGSLATTSAGVVLTEADGSTWVFTPGSTTGTNTAPGGLTKTLTSNSSGYTLTDLKTRDVTKFDTSGNALSVTDKNSNTTTINYTGGNAVSVVSPAGPTAARTATLGDDSAGYVFSQTNNYSTRNIHYAYDSGSGNITCFTDAAGKTTSFAYTGTDLTTITSPTGAVTNITYSGTTHKVAKIDQQNTTTGSPGTSTTRLTYPSSSQTLVAEPNTDTSVAVASGPRTTYDLNSSQLLVNTATDPMRRKRSKTHNANSLPLTSTSGSSGATGSTTTTAEYKANDNNSATSVTQQGGATSTATYSSSSASSAYLPQTITSDSGSGSSTQTLTYSGAGNQLTSSTGSGATLAQSTLTYNTDGTVATALAPGNGTNKTVYAYNADHQLSTVTPVTGAGLGVKTTTYDDFGRIKKSRPMVRGFGGGVNVPDLGLWRSSSSRRSSTGAKRTDSLCCPAPVKSPPSIWSSRSRPPAPGPCLSSTLESDAFLARLRVGQSPYAVADIVCFGEDVV